MKIYFENLKLTFTCKVRCKIVHLYGKKVERPKPKKDHIFWYYLTNHAAIYQEEFIEAAWNLIKPKLKCKAKWVADTLIINAEILKKMYTLGGIET